MIDHKQYIKDATRTESVPAQIVVDRRLLLGALQMTVAASQVLDLVKKKAFYRNKPMTIEALEEQKVKDQAVLGAAVNLADMGIGAIEVSDFKGESPEVIDIDVRVFHAAIGLSTETGEIVEALLKSIDEGVPLDRANLLEELGDLNWYQAVGIDALDGDLQKILETNIAKLKARYSEKYSDEAAVNRDLTAEREILEQGAA